MKKLKLKNLTLIALFAALICVSAIISIPFVVPITMQTLLISLCVGLIGTKRAFFAVLTYVFIGVLGLPVFAGLQGGVAALFNNTGGFILGFLGFVVIKGVTQKHFKTGVWGSFFSGLMGLIPLYIIGSVWFCFIYYGSINLPTYISSLAVSVLPFILPDIIKIFIASLIEKRIKKFF